jgi:acid phosphatase (class A)
MSVIPKEWKSVLTFLSDESVAEEEELIELKPVYIRPSAVRFKTLVVGPPCPGSMEEWADIEQVLSRQRIRREDEEIRIRRESQLSVFVFEDVLGPWFTPKNLPLLATLFQKVLDDSSFVTKAAGEHWSRLRPAERDKRVKPATATPSLPSYPAENGAYGFLFGLLLSEMVPDRDEEMIERGRMIGEYRVLAGVNYPSDLAAGQVLARELAYHFAVNPDFEVDFIRAKKEFDRVRARYCFEPAEETVAETLVVAEAA